MSAKAPAAKKKVRPYPFPGTLDLNSVKRSIEVIRLTPEGFIANLMKCIVHTGERYQAVLEIPATHNFVNSQVRVIKTYDRSVDPKKHVVDRVAEFHFESLTEHHKEYILSFLVAIGQK